MHFVLLLLVDLVELLSSWLWSLRRSTKYRFFFLPFDILVSGLGFPIDLEGPIYADQMERWYSAEVLVAKC